MGHRSFACCHSTSDPQSWIVANLADSVCAPANDSNALSHGVSGTVVVVVAACVVVVAVCVVVVAACVVVVGTVEVFVSTGMISGLVPPPQAEHMTTPSTSHRITALRPQSRIQCCS